MEQSAARILVCTTQCFGHEADGIEAFRGVFRAVVDLPRADNDGDAFGIVFAHGDTVKRDGVIGKAVKWLGWQGSLVWGRIAVLSQALP